MIMEMIYNLIQEKLNACVHQSFLIIILLLFTKWKAIQTFCGGLDIVTDIFS